MLPEKYRIQFILKCKALSLQVPSAELESRNLAGVVQIYKNGRRKNICWFNRGITREDVISGMTVRILSSTHIFNSITHLESEG